MGKHRPIKTKFWLAFITHHGCKFHSKPKGGSSHVTWKCPNCLRGIIFRPADKEIPAMHLQTNLKTMGLTFDDLQTWIKDNC